jgi:glycosyltransferase involved in cell wall biosynthesis
MITNPQITLIISTYNRPDALRLVLDSIITQSVLPNEVIIADDGSNIETTVLINHFIENTKFPIIHCWQEDNGFQLSQIRNKAISLAKFDYIISIDGDMILHPNFIEDHKKYAKPGYFIQGSRVLLKPVLTSQLLKHAIFNILFFSRGIKNRNHTIRNEFLSTLFYRKLKNKYKCIKGCNMAFWKNDLIKVNGYNEDFVSWGSEDKELVARLYNIKIYGKRVKYAAIAYHLYHPRSFDKVKLLENNRLLDLAKSQKLTYCTNGINKENNPK